MGFLLLPFADPLKIGAKKNIDSLVKKGSKAEKHDTAYFF